MQYTKRKFIAKLNNPTKNGIGIKYGNRNLIIGSYNDNTLRTKESIDTLLYTLRKTT